MEILNFSPDEIRVFTLILIRISVVLFLFPILGSPVFPPLAKMGLALIFTFVLFPVVKVDPALFPKDAVQTVILMVSEFMIGMLLGLTVRFLFAAIQLAGQVIGFQMGFSMINVVDPQSGDNVSITEQISFWIAMLVFLAIGGHHILIMALVDSFSIINVGVFTIHAGFAQKIIALSAEIFPLGIKIGAPAIAALLCTSAAFGICAKFVPQMNIMIVAFPLKIAVGLAMIGVCFQIIIIVERNFVSDFSDLLHNLMRWMAA
ncbi:MAG: flagellar biosynthetic protein FliR [Desulfobacterales bacterium]|nr:flagellar biosynthetic protein FliR [Desulfobacterales bacterium]MCP4161719.1 flagellar biosynthetic protein FliR [Deltaproteobacteria bacterium]